jgi:hypothetical protein
LSNQISVSHGATLNSYLFGGDPEQIVTVRPSGDFERFEGLATPLLQVSNAELDEKLAQDD